MSVPTRDRDSIELVSFGCRLNIVESEAMEAAARTAGHCDVTIVNTCAVTAESARQARQAIRRLHREAPDRRIIVTGCAAEVDSATFLSLPGVAGVLPNASKGHAHTWEKLPGASQTATPANPAAQRAHTRAFVEIQNGCDHRCTFCIIPLGRGPSRSRSADAILVDIAAKVAGGCREAVLTGVDLTSWGHDLPEKPQTGELVRRILREIPDLERLRLSSIDCVEADEALLEAFATERRLMPHLHLSLQAGDDLVLKRMKRRHLRADSIRFCTDLRKARPDMIFGADFIAGFPTETDDMFVRTCDLVEEAGLTHLHVFPFSPRAGTPAARMPPVDPGLVRQRAAQLREIGARRLSAHLDNQVGRTLRVLTERGGRALSEDFSAVRLEGVARGEILDVEITGHDGRELRARPPASHRPPALDAYGQAAAPTH